MPQSQNNKKHCQLKGKKQLAIKEQISIVVIFPISAQGVNTAEIFLPSYTE